MLQRAEAILAASSRLEMTARQLSQGVEPKLTVAISDTYQSDRFEAALVEFEQRYPDLELECLIAECDDLIELVQRGRAHLAFAEMQDSYPPDLVTSTVAERTEIALFVNRDHALARRRTHRSGRSCSSIASCAWRPSSIRMTAAAKGRVWSAPSYLMLLEMAEKGFGWAPLPRWLVERFGNGSLVELNVRGWPRPVFVDALWSRLYPPGPAGSWLLSKMLE